MPVMTPLRRSREQALRPLFAYLEEYGIRKAWLAAKLGIHRRKLFGYEHGEAVVPPGFIDDCCAALGVKPERFGWTSTRKRGRPRKAAAA
jgi:hypothetical protein